jgi:hypothetical protein
MVIQWIGVVLTVLGLALNTYKEIGVGQEVFVKNKEPQQNQNSVQYVTITIAYDHSSGVHYFQHLDGKWYLYPPKP